MYESCPHCYGTNNFNAIFCTHCLEPLRDARRLFGSLDALKFLLLSLEIQKLPRVKNQSPDEPVP